MDSKDVIYRHEPLWGCWKVDNLIGKGSFGSVYKISRNEWGYNQVSAVKVISIKPNEMDDFNFSFEKLDDSSIENYYKDIIKNIIREIELLYRLKGNTNIVSYEDHMVCPGENKLEWNIFIRMEYLIPLSSYIVKTPLKVNDVLQLGIDICTALELCRKENIMHRDIKEANIFISKNGAFKIGDFGISRELLRSTSIASMKGTPYYMAPETFRDNKYDERVDIYSLGLVLYKLFNYGRMPLLPPYPQSFSNSDREKAFEQRITGKKFSPPILAPDSIQKIILKACNFKPTDRFMSAAEMKKALLDAANSLSIEYKEKIVSSIKNIAPSNTNTTNRLDSQPTTTIDSFEQVDNTLTEIIPGSADIKDTKKPSVDLSKPTINLAKNASAITKSANDSIQSNMNPIEPDIISNKTPIDLAKKNIAADKPVVDLSKSDNSEDKPVEPPIKSRINLHKSSDDISSPQPKENTKDSINDKSKTNISQDDLSLTQTIYFDNDLIKDLKVSTINKPGDDNQKTNSTDPNIEQNNLSPEKNLENETSITEVDNLSLTQTFFFKDGLDKKIDNKFSHPNKKKMPTMQPYKPGKKRAKNLTYGYDMTFSDLHHKKPHNEPEDPLSMTTFYKKVVKTETLFKRLFLITISIALGLILLLIYLNIREDIKTGEINKYLDKIPFTQSDN